jgi:hypothetical protein
VSGGCDGISGSNRAGGDLFYLRMAVLALNSAERYYTAFTLVLSVAVMCIAILEHYGAPSLSLR